MKRFASLVLALLVFAVIVIAPVDPELFPVQARYVAAVTALMVLLWITEAIPLEATAFLPLILFPVLGVLSPAEASAAYADRVIFLFLGGFIIAMSMQRWGLHRRIALNIISKAGNSPRLLVLGFMIATAFLSMWISNTATTMMMIPIAVAIVGTVIPAAGLRFEEHTDTEKALATCLIISIPYAASIGGISTIIGSPPNGIFVAQLAALFPEAPRIDFVTWMAFGVPLAATFLLLAWFWLTRGPYRLMPKQLADAEDTVRANLKGMGTMSTGERWTLFVFVATALGWIFANSRQIGDIVIPGLDMLFPGIHDSTIAIFGAFLLFILPTNIRKGEFTMNWEWAVKIPWGILLLFGGGICLSEGFIRSGLASEIVSYLTAFGGLPLIVTVLFVAIVVSLAGEIASNTAMAAVLIPITGVLAVSMGINPYYLMLTATICSSYAFMLPVATPPNAIAYGSGYITSRDLMRSGWVLNFIGVALWTLALFTIVTWVLGLTPDLPFWAITG